MSSTRSAQRSSRAGILAPAYRLVTLGTLAIVFLNAFENLAVATVMPVISKDLHGAALYAVAFAGPLAIAVVGMVIAGSWSDRSGPRRTLVASIVVFAVGLVLAGVAPSMELLVAGRLLYGLAGGALTVALFVLVGRTYPEELQPQIFGSMAAAWIVPALIGPAIAGILADGVGWRWVFLGVVGLVVVAAVTIAPALRALGTATVDPRPGWSIRRIAWAIVLAVAVLGLSLAGELPTALTAVVAVSALVIALIALRPLVPVATLRAHRGLPAVIALRLVLTGAYFGAEIYLPYLLTSEFGLPASVAGLSLTGAAITWGGVSYLQGRMSDRISPRTSILFGVVIVVVAIIAPLVTAAAHLTPWLAIAGWAIGGVGMGLVFPRLSVMMLGYSTERTQGFNSAALSIADSVGPAISLAVIGILFQSLRPGVGDAGAFSATFLVDLAIGILGIVVATRVVSRPVPAGDRDTA